MKSITRNYLAMSLLALCVGVPSSYAMHHHNMSEEDMAQWEQKKEEKWNKVYEELGLSESQVSQITSQREMNKETMKASREEMKQTREALKAQLDAPETDRAEVDRLIARIGELSAEKARHRADKVLSLKSILTPEQFQELQKHKSEMREKKRAKKKEKWGKKAQSE